MRSLITSTAGIVRRYDALYDFATFYGQKLQRNPRSKAQGTFWIAALTIVFVGSATAARSSWGLWWLLLIVATGLQLWATVREACEAFYEVETEADESIVKVASRALSENLREVQSKVAELSQLHPSRQPDLSREAANLVVTTILGTYAHLRGVRVAVFLLNEEKTEAHPLVARGRQDEPRQFVRDDGARSRAFFAWVDGNDRTPRFELDTHTADGEVASKRYGTYVSTLIYNSINIYGMLTVDATIEASIDEEDKHLIQAFAGELATAFTIQRPSAATVHAGNGSIKKRSR